jgi:hypothetical protein
MDRAYPEKIQHRTGQLFLQIAGYADNVRRKWSDGIRQNLEALIPSIADGFEVLIAARKAQREEREERDRQWRELERRRGLARDRAKREELRTDFVGDLAARYEEISRVDRWLGAMQPIAVERPGTSYARMVEWLVAKLDRLISSIDPADLERELSEKKLFPARDEDELHDPLGEPPSSRYW